MDKKRFFSALIMAVVLSVGTYVGLSYFKPYKPEELKLAANPSVEEVFGGTLNPADPDTAAAPVAAAAADAVSSPAENAAGTAPVEAAAMDLASLADESPVHEDAAAAPVDAAPAEAAPVEPAAAPSVVEAEPVAPAPEAAPVEAAAAPAPKPKPAVKRYTGSREAAAPEVATKAWWNGSGDAGSLALSYAGAASYKKAIALLFNGTFESAESVNQNVVVKNAAGKVVSGNWEVSAANKRLLVLDVSKTGTYTVTVKSGLTDQSGKSLANTVSGPVNVY